MQLNSHTVLRHMDKHTATYSERETHMRFTFADGGATSESETKPLSHGERPTRSSALFYDFKSRRNYTAKSGIYFKSTHLNVIYVLIWICIGVFAGINLELFEGYIAPGFTIQWVGRAFSVCTIYQRLNIFYVAVIRATAYSYSSSNVNPPLVSTALQTVLTCLVSALCASLCAAAPVSQLGVFAQPSVSVHNGHTTTLPCWLSPSQNAEGLEVRWYREGHYDSPVMLYRGKKFESASQSASYAGRVSFGPKDAASTGLVAGDVSLMLINATLEDAGDYICYVTSERGYDSGSVKLTVTGKKAKEEVDGGRKQGSDDAEENQKLLQKENVTLDQKENEYLKIIENRKLRDDGDKIFPDGQNVTCLTAIKGTPGFTSGQHYWEVSLVNKATGLKQSWWLGATSASVIPQDKDFIPTPSNGYWFLSSRADHFQFNTEPNVVLPVYSRPETVGVYLNYDSGELSFYDVQKQSLIGSLTTTFTGEVFPLFNPGKNDKTPMEILHKPVQGQSDNAENGDPTISAGKNDTAPPEEVHMTGQGQSSDTENRNSTAQ
ncbi:E3 ubiquitin-protein ligase TRIM39 [Collichthys lucidus]|uniref:E3 ubiquitin-protein ligase TRIM39 n=1 Tax=Collichthys lucidus TaxID=240159 RepID=A0A4U5VYZ3_COLLU|nr:E3 ubiquitin-protein ligase TRIM39 [Collichthys lucidus]